MNRIQKQIEPDYQNICNCSNFLSSIDSWQDILSRYKEQHNLVSTLVCLTDTKEDWIVDLFRCSDCGRYWAREDVGDPFLTKAMLFFYHVDTSEPQMWLNNPPQRLVLDRLKRDETFFQHHIYPKIKLT
jgi:hypothetical protein